MSADYKRILILYKTYPSPSAKHVETSCVAGMDDSGRLIRLFPVPFRLITDDQQFIVGIGHGPVVYECRSCVIQNTTPRFHQAL